MTKPKILIIDDEPLIRTFIAGALEEEGYDLHFASDGQDGLNQAIALQPDLIFLDIRMPILDGVSFLREFHKQTATPCPIIAMTGYKDDRALDQCYQLDVFVLISKPLYLNEIIALARRYTRLPQTREPITFDIQSVESLGRQAASLGLDSTAFQYFIDAIPFPVFVKDEDRIYIHTNSAFENFTGLDRDKLLGKTSRDLQLKDLTDREATLEEELLRKGGVFEHEKSVSDAKGLFRDVVIYRSVITRKNDGEHPVAILGIIIDINDLGIKSFKKKLALKYPRLSPRECEVADLVRQAMSNKEIAEQLHISLSTVEYHRNNLRDKLGIKGDNINLSTTLLTI
ncbi:MAG: response regulator [Proteobacteria bacterium]|nr:response regulator [Pseudomonadota bacterium]MBU1417997.1 response regulator [Pseudomonadota bacterium]MBU1455952.1 response regulator [Pseudomonadota bacterium]